MRDAARTALEYAAGKQRCDLDGQPMLRDAIVRQIGILGEAATPVNWRDYVERRADVMNGKPVFKGTRVTVEHVLQELADGMAEDDLLRGHPRLTRDHLRASWAYAAAVIGHERTVLE